MNDVMQKFYFHEKPRKFSVLHAVQGRQENSVISVPQIKTQNFTEDRITEFLGSEGTSGGHLVHPTLLEAGSPRVCLLRSVSSQVLSIFKDGESITSLGNLCQCTNHDKSFFLCLKRISCASSLCPFPLGLSAGITKKVWLHFIYFLSLGIYTH